MLGFTPGHPAVYFVPRYYVRCPVSGTKSASMSGAPRFTSSTPVSCQVPGSRQIPGFYVRRPGLHQALDSTSGAQVYIRRLVLPQTPRYVRHPVSMSGTRFYIRRQDLRQAPVPRQTPGSSQAPRFTSGAQFLRHTAGFCIRRPHQVLGFYTRGHVGCPGLRQEPSFLMRLVFTSGAQVYVSVQVLH